MISSTKNQAAVFTGLKVAQRYLVSLVVVVPGGTISSQSPIVISTASALTPAPVLTFVDATSPTTGTMTSSPQSTACPTGLCVAYIYTLKPRGGADAVTVTCATPGPCAAKGLLPTTTYDVTVVARDAANNPTASSKSQPLRTMDYGAPMLIAADPTSPTTGTVESVAPETGCKAGPCTAYVYSFLTASSHGRNTTLECPTIEACNVSGLTSNTEYEVTVEALDAEGNLLPGANSLTLTTPGLPGPEIVVCEATNITAGRLRAAPPGLGCESGTCVSYIFTLKPTAGALKVVNLSCPLAGDCLVTGLEDNTGYEVTAVAVDSLGNPSPVSDPAYLSTPPLQPPILTDVDALDPTTGYATSLAPSTGCKTGPCTNYTYTIYPRSGEAPTHISCPTPGMCSLTGLTADSTFFVTVIARDAAGNPTPASRSTRFLTPPYRAPIMRTATATGPTTAVFTASEPQTGCLNGPCKLFLFVVRVKEAGGGSFTFTCASPNKCKATGLTASTTYEVTALAKDAAGSTSPPSAYLEFRTP